MKIYPSMLSADFSKFGEELQAVEKAGADGIHWDIMDGSFVNEITFGSKTIRDLRGKTNLRFDVHLMVEHPETHIDRFIDAGADAIILHQESTRHMDYLLTKIKKSNKMAGIALNPATPPECLRYVSELLDVVLVMTVNPGASGQKFIRTQLQKICDIREAMPAVEICIDGGIDNDTSKQCAAAGATSCVTGAYLFQHAGRYEERICALKA